MGTGVAFDKIYLNKFMVCISDTETLLVSYYVEVWLLSIVFLVFCFELFDDHSIRNTSKLPNS